MKNRTNSVPPLVTRAFAAATSRSESVRSVRPPPSPGPTFAPVVTSDPHRQAMRLAADADCDVRSARRAIAEGPDAVRGRAGERIRLAAAALGIELGGQHSTASNSETGAA